MTNPVGENDVDAARTEEGTPRGPNSADVPNTREGDAVTVVTAGETAHFSNADLAERAWWVSIFGRVPDRLKFPGERAESPKDSSR